MFIATLYVVFLPGQQFPQTRKFESCRWWNSAASVVIVSVEIYLCTSVYPGGSLFILCTLV